MCFIKKISLQEDEYKEITEVLNKDLIVFKIMNKVTTRFPFSIKRVSYYAPFYPYKYEKKKVNTSPLDIAIRKDVNNIIINVDKGFHSFRTLRGTVVINDTQIVSDKIIFIEELK